jgi:hypothetical protein
MESAEIEGNGDGFLTPTKKHRVSATSAAEAATAMEGIIETDNPHAALMPLKPSQNRGSSTAKSPSGSSPWKKKPKVSPKFMKQMEAQLEKQREEESTINDDDIAVSLLGWFGGAVKAGVAIVAGYATQDETVTGENTNWQDRWESSISDDEE